MSQVLFASNDSLDLGTFNVFLRVTNELVKTLEDDAERFPLLNDLWELTSGEDVSKDTLRALAVECVNALAEFEWSEETEDTLRRLQDFSTAMVK